MIRAVLCTAILVTTSAAHAQDPRGCIDELSESELDQRLMELDAHFERNKRRARWHFYGFMSLFGAIGIGQIVLATQANERVDRFSNGVGAAGALLMTLQIGVITETGALAPQRYRRQPDGTLSERRAKLRYGLDLLERSSDRATTLTSALAHLSPMVWSGTWATVIMLKFDSPLTVLRLVGGGLFLTESRTLSTPRGSVRSWESVRGSFCGGRYVRRYSSEELDTLERGEPIAQRTHFQFTFGGFRLSHQF